MRDDFSNRTKQLLAKRVSLRCSNPDCLRITVGASSDPGKVTNIGVAAHICAAAEGGPRYDPSMTAEERSSHNNGIWLCQTCSVLIDKDPDFFSVDLLHKWKSEAERKSMRKVYYPNNELEDSEHMNDEELNQWVVDYYEEMERPDNRSEILNDITALLASGRSRLSWDNRSELKLYQWLEEHSEDELPALDEKELKVIRQSLVDYLRVHVEMDKAYTIPDEDSSKVGRQEVFCFIENHPGTTTQSISKGVGLKEETLLPILHEMQRNNIVIPLFDDDAGDIPLSSTLWIKNYGHPKAHFSYLLSKSEYNSAK